MDEISLYVAVDDIGMCKVGISANPARRVNDLAAGYYGRLKLRWSRIIGDAAAARVLERKVQEHLADRHVCGEWFKGPADIVIGSVLVAQLGIKPNFFWIGGNEFVAMSKNDHDLLCAPPREMGQRAEDRATARLVDEHLAAKERGEAVLIPSWFVDLVLEHGSPVKAARKHTVMTQAQLAHVLNISQGHLSDLETGRRQLTVTQRHQIAGVTGIEAAWLEE